ncbi:MAG: hypothetical protein K0R54_1843 [Clostridiaceae bacterium]|jgi:hypothetical protein|nr:hypothetical protein [Clostridiaceae bacterium]
MNDIKLNQIRKWKTDTNNEHFKIIVDNGIHYGNHFYIIEYLTDKRKQTVTEPELIRSVISNVYDDIDLN